MSLLAPKRLIAVFMLSSLLSLLVSPALQQQNALAAPGDETTTGTISLTPTIECIGAVVTYTGDNNENNSITLEYRQAGAGAWLLAPEMYNDQTTNSEFRGSIFWLTTNTTYEVRVTISDPDGVTGTNPLIGTVTTRNDNPPSQGNSYYISLTGNDSDDGSIGSPWRTFQYAVDNVSAGDTIYIRGGTYYLAEVSITADGTANNYITITNYGAETVILDGSTQDEGRIFWLEGASYWRIKGIQFRYARTSHIRVGSSTHVIIEDCTFIDPNLAQGGTRGAIRLDYGTSNTLIQNNYISVDAGEQRVTCGITFWEAGDGHVVRYNTITSSTGALRDGIGGGPEDNYVYQSNWDVYGNTIVGATDDGIQLEAAGVNNRIWNNRIEGSLIGIAVCPVKLGPTYIIRNVVVDSYSYRPDRYGAAFVKLGDGSIGRIYLYHNTFWTDWIYVLPETTAGANGLSQTNNGLANVVSKNNIYHASRYIMEMPTIYPDYEPMEFDYDLIYTVTPTNRFIEWIKAYHSVEDLYAETGQYQHSLEGQPDFVDINSRNMRLAAGSLGIDSGASLVGFNDANSPWPYSGAAPDIGAYEYGSGGPTNYPPVLSTIGDRSVNIESPLQFTVFAIDPNGDPLSYSASNLPLGADFDPQTRTFSWTPDSSQVGSYPNVHFEVSDGSAADSENITITVRSGENEPPVLNTIGNKSVSEGELLQFTISATDPNDDSLTYSASNLPLGANFNSQTRTFSWTPNSNQVGSHPNVHFEVSDGPLTDSENITITVTTGEQITLPLRVNAGGNVYSDSQGNTWQADQDYVPGSWGFYGEDHTKDRGTGYAISGTTDDRIYQTLRYDLNGYKFDLGNGTYTISLHFAETYYTSSGARIFNISIEGQSVIDNLDIYSEAGYSTALVKTITNVVVQDGQLDIEIVPSLYSTFINGIEIFVAGGNHAPVLSPIGNKPVTEEELLQFTIYATDADDDPLTFSADNLPLGADFNPETRTFSWTPNSSQVGSYPDVHFEVSDGSLTDSENIAINVLSSDNSAPVLDTIGNRSVREGETLEFTISATDPDDDMLTFSADNLTLGADFDPETRTFSWTPALGQRGNYSYISFQVTDGVLSDSEYIIITVTANDPPVLYDIGDRSVREGKTLEFTISATDPDDDPITYSAFYLPQGASFDPETRVFSWRPSSDQIGTYPDIFFKASDGAFSDAERITITVLSLGNNAPVLETIGDQTINETELLEFTISATDPDDDPLTFSADNLPDGASFDTENGEFSWIPELGEADTYENIHFEVSDGELTVSENIIITVYILTSLGGGGGGDVDDDDPGGGGSGGIGGDLESSPDETPPVIEEVVISDVSTDNAVIRWTTTEPSTSQVEYWASPSKFSPLDETLVTEHEIYLTGLAPGTDYHYRTLSQDEVGNLATSPEYDFTTKPAAFIVSWLTISPAEADIGQEITISTLITNTGEVTESHDVILSIDDTVEATESIVDLASGASQETTFIITRETAGVYTVNVNGTTGTLVVSDVEESATAIELFSITPNSESDTGVITFARADYGIYESYYSTLFSELDAELILKVGLGSEALEEVTFIASGQSEPDMSTGSLNYIPAEGWTSGTYTFQAELRTGEGVIETSPPVRLIITPATAAGVASWATLGEIIGGVLIIALLVVLLILHRNRDMLRAQSLE